MKAVILAGGEGTRLRPLTSNTPKPMMEHIVNLLSLHGFDEIVVTVAFLANQIRDYFGDGSDFGVTMRYAAEDSPLDNGSRSTLPVFHSATTAAVPVVPASGPDTRATPLTAACGSRVASGSGAVVQSALFSP